MARPSMAAQRCAEILDAFETCILKQGIAGTSLEMLAEQAQMKRSILRHYIGNRDKIIEQLAERWYAQYREQWQMALGYLPQNNRLEALVEMLFSERDNSYADKVIIGEALFIEAKRLPALKRQVQASSDQFIEIFTTEIKRQSPNVDSDKAAAMAHGVYGIYLMGESMIALGTTRDIPKLKQATLLLLRC